MAEANDADRPGRDKLLAAAADLFVEKGYRATTFVDIAARAGVSRGSIAWHFGGKEGLLAAVLDDQFAQLSESISQLESTSNDRLPDFLAQLFQGSTLRLSQLFVTLYVEALDPATAAHEQFVGIHDQIRARLQAWAVTAGLTPAVDGHDVSVLLFGTALGVTMQWMLAPDRVDPHTLTATLTSLLTPSGDK